jgi:hypothetical protein
MTNTIQEIEPAPYKTTVAIRDLARRLAKARKDSGDAKKVETRVKTELDVAIQAELKLKLGEDIKKGQFNDELGRPVLKVNWVGGGYSEDEWKNIDWEQLCKKYPFIQELAVEEGFKKPEPKGYLVIGCDYMCEEVDVVGRPRGRRKSVVNHTTTRVRRALKAA